MSIRVPKRLDSAALKVATSALADWLQNEADHQQAYFKLSEDGRGSFELEWVNLEALSREVIKTYINSFGDPR